MAFRTAARVRRKGSARHAIAGIASKRRGARNWIARARSRFPVSGFSGGAGNVQTRIARHPRPRGKLSAICCRGSRIQCRPGVRMKSRAARRPVLLSGRLSFHRRGLSSTRARVYGSVWTRKPACGHRARAKTGLTTGHRVKLRCDGFLAASFFQRWRLLPHRRRHSLLSAALGSWRHSTIRISHRPAPRRR